jgi:hypothetical protein
MDGCAVMSDGSALTPPGMGSTDAGVTAAESSLCTSTESHGASLMLASDVSSADASAALSSLCVSAALLREW